MARPNPELISAIENTFLNLSKGASYQWGHMGACNCGNLAQELTQLTKGEIHAYAMQRHGDWSEQILEFCPTSGYPMDLMIEKMLLAGLTLEDLKHLENLSDPEILAMMSKEKRNSISKNSKEDVIYYRQNRAKLLREKWVSENSEINFKNLKKKIAKPIFS
jgi:hypothetical protein